MQTFDLFSIELESKDRKECYCFPTLLTPENTPLNMDGLPVRYVSAGTFVSKPVEYSIQCQEDSRSGERSCGGKYTWLGDLLHQWPFKRKTHTLQTFFQLKE